MMPAHYPTPTPEQWDQSGIAQAEILEVMQRLTAEGMDWRIVATGVATATAHIVRAHAGDAEVPIWFARMSALTMHMAKSELKKDLG